MRYLIIVVVCLSIAFRLDRGVHKALTVYIKYLPRPIINKERK